MRSSPPAKGLFLDRDGTLIFDKVYLADPEGVELIPGAADALRRARALGYRLFLFTNQSGVGRGYHTLGDTLRVNARMEQLLGLPPPLFDEICIAPEHPDATPVYRKPSPRYIRETVARFGLDPARTWIVGDAASDFRAGLAAGIRAAAVKSGKIDPSSHSEVQDGRVPVYPALKDFVDSLQ